MTITRAKHLLKSRETVSFLTPRGGVRGRVTGVGVSGFSDWIEIRSTSGDTERYRPGEVSE